MKQMTFWGSLFFIRSHGKTGDYIFA